MKKYKLGMILGRFQIFHKGHESIINKALELCDEVIILIGSADKYGTYENPFNYDTRRIIIEEVYKDRVIIAPLNDLGVGNVPKWGDYVIESCKKIKDIPDLVIYGDEDKCKEWYKNYPNIEYFKIDILNEAVENKVSMIKGGGAVKGTKGKKYVASDSEYESRPEPSKATESIKEILT